MATTRRIEFRIVVGGVTQMDRFIEVTAKRVDDLRQAWPATDHVFEGIIAGQFETEGQRGGTPWPDLAPSTVEERARLGFGPRGPILQRSGALLRSFLNRNDQHSVSEHDRQRWVRGSSSPHRPDVHQTGSRSGGIPARPIIQLTERDRLDLIRPVRNWVVGADPWAGVPARSTIADFNGLAEKAA